MSSVAQADPIAPLAFTTQVQSSRVIQGAQDPIYAYLYNFAPVGSPATIAQVTAAYGFLNPASLGGYLGPVAATGGATFLTLPFPLNTSNLSPGSFPYQVTTINKSTGGSSTQSGQFTVLAHAKPALFAQGQIIPLSKPNLISFAAPAFAEAGPTGTEAAGGAYSPTMLGDPPPGVPTAELDLDAVSSFGSPDITTTLAPFTDLPSNDDPAQGLPFQINFLVPSLGDYSTTFLLYYSDEQDLPGADLPGSELASFNVNVDVTAATAYWTITTDTVPEPNALVLIALGICTLIHFARRVHAGRRF
ncbi:MAG TPA: hypothetical protein VGP62_08570 [Bryobacteraceae bacterium]|nr:hypothetical protein [Bryobacteraceae bacterium]